MSYIENMYQVLEKMLFDNLEEMLSESHFLVLLSFFSRGKIQKTGQKMNKDSRKQMRHILLFTSSNILNHEFTNILEKQ